MKWNLISLHKRGSTYIYVRCILSFFYLLNLFRPPPQKKKIQRNIEMYSMIDCVFCIYLSRANSHKTESKKVSLMYVYLNSLPSTSKKIENFSSIFIHTTLLCICNFPSYYLIKLFFLFLCFLKKKLVAYWQK